MRKYYNSIFRSAQLRLEATVGDGPSRVHGILSLSSVSSWRRFELIDSVDTGNYRYYEEATSGGKHKTSTCVLLTRR
jgi:hypothetical protein